MSHLEMETLIFCAECDQIVNETIDTIRWFELNFCALKCFSKFYRKNAIVCQECENPLTSKKIQVRKLPNYPDTKSNTAAGQQITLSSSSILDSIYFCSPKCLEGFQNRVHLCKFCGALSSSNKPFCSEKCRYLTVACSANNTSGVGVCGECHEKKNIVVRMVVDKHKYIMCSSRCFEDFIKKNDLVLETCGNCLQHFKNSNNITYIIQENLCNSTFCSVACLNNYMFTNSKKIECHACKSYNHYFEMIRGSIRLGTRAWCSLECAANELSTINLAAIVGKTASNTEEAQMDLLDAVPVVNEKGNGIPAEAADQGVDKPIDQSVQRESFTHEKIQKLTKVETDRLIKERLDSFVRKCGSCESTISNAQPFLRWFVEEFCNQLCFDEYLKSNNGCVCWNCDSIIGITKLCVHAEYVENNLRLFCSVGCQSSYLKSIKMCEYCHKIMNTPETVAQQANRFCSELCQKEHTRIFNIETDPKTVQAICTDCDKMKEVKVLFVYNGKEYPFCSYSCAFFLKFSCGLFPDKCILCEKFFIRNATNRYTVRFDNMANYLCSDICMANFMLKHRYTVACQFCLDQNFNFNMLQLISDKGTKIKYFCSKSCLELVDECAKMATDYIPNGLVPTEKNLAASAMADDEGFHGSPEKVTRDVSVQTNMQCTCQKENVRQILTPARPVKRTSSQFLRPSMVQGVPIKPFKQHRQ